jgi:hypothetical protein
MKKNLNLHFLLALGNTKIVMLKNKDKMDIYTQHTGKGKAPIAPERVLDALVSR